MRTVASLALAFGFYVALSCLLYGNVLVPIWLATRWPNRGLPLWIGLAVVATAASAWLAFRVLDKRLAPFWRPSAFVIFSIVFSTLAVGLCADAARHIAIYRLSPDRLESRSFFTSIEAAPRDFQLFLHTAALKHCVAYAWSYREMTFYQLGPDVAVNVVPRDWIDMCSIKRTDRSEQPCAKTSCIR